MLFLKQTQSALALCALIAISILSVPGNCAKCCVSNDVDVEGMKLLLTNLGYTNVHTNSNTCDQVSYSGTTNGIVVTYTYNALNNNAVEVIMFMTVSGNAISTVKDTTQDFCTNAVKKGAPTILPLSSFVSVPSTFHNQVKITFNNPSQSAKIQIFNVRGVKVAEQHNISESQYTWIPKGLNQGPYLVRVVTREAIFAKQVIYLK
jgi:hypothetical protein